MVALLCVVGFTAMGTFVGVYNAVSFRLQAPPFQLGAAASLVYLAYPIGIAAPGSRACSAERIGRGRTVAAGLVLLIGSVLLVSLPSLPTVVAGLALLGFAFLGVHSLLSGWVVDRARRRGRGTAQASSAYLGTYYLGSTIAGALATWLWQNGGWSGVAALTLGLAACALLASFAATRADPMGRSTDRVDSTHPSPPEVHGVGTAGGAPVPADADATGQLAVFEPPGVDEREDQAVARDGEAGGAGDPCDVQVAIGSLSPQALRVTGPGTRLRLPLEPEGLAGE